MRRVTGIVFLFVCAVGWPQSFSFHTGVTYPAQLGPLATVSADFNGDGKLDLAVANAAASSVTIFLGKGDGTFSDGATVAIPGECIDDNITAGDFNNDGKIDLLTVCGFQTTVWVLPGLGTGQFGTPIATNLPATAVYGFFDVFNYQEVAVADFNGDGNLDLVVGLLGETGKNEAINLLLGKGDGTFQVPSIVTSGFTGAVIVTADFNGDGKPDLAVDYETIGTKEVSPSGFTILLGNGDGTFQSGAS